MPIKQHTQEMVQESMTRHGEYEQEIVLPDSTEIEQYGYLSQSGEIIDRKSFNKLMLARERTYPHSKQGGEQ